MDGTMGIADLVESIIMEVYKENNIKKMTIFLFVLTFLISSFIFN
jgi:hypothetical protein